MTKKRLTRDLKWGFQYFPYYQMRIECDGFHGWAALNELTDGEYIYWDFFEKAGKVPVAGKGMCWLTLIPDGRKHSVTAMFTENGDVSAWYDALKGLQKQDIIKAWGILNHFEALPDTP